MAPAKKPRTPSRSPQTRQIEFTPGQMIIAICTLIVFGLVCFMLGVLVNRLDNSFTPPEPQTAQVEPLEVETPAPAETPPPRAQQTSPRPPEALRDQQRVAQNETQEARSPAQPRSVAPPPAGPRAQAPTAPEPPRAPAATPPAQPERPQPPAEEETAEPETTETEPATPEPRVLENVDPITPDDEPEVEDEAAQVEPATPRAPAAGATAYGVQIASVSADRRDQARGLLTDAERTVNQPGRMVPTDDGRMLRLIVGAFENRADATRLMEEMRRQSRFEGCFVQTFTQPL